MTVVATGTQLQEGTWFPVARAVQPPALPRSPEACEMLDVKAVAKMLSCSSRSVLRLSASGGMPKPHKFGNLARWSYREILDWIAGLATDSPTTSLISPLQELDAIRDDEMCKAVRLTLEPLAVGSAGAAAACGVSESNWRKLTTTGRAPAGRRVGKRVLWTLSELRTWVEGGMNPVNEALAERYRLKARRELELVSFAIASRTNK